MHTYLTTTKKMVKILKQEDVMERIMACKAKLTNFENESAHYLALAGSGFAVAKKTQVKDHILFDINDGDNGYILTIKLRLLPEYAHMCEVSNKDGGVFASKGDMLARAKRTVDCLTFFNAKFNIMAWTTFVADRHAAVNMEYTETLKLFNEYKTQLVHSATASFEIDEDVCYYACSHDAEDVIFKYRIHNLKLRSISIDITKFDGIEDFSEHLGTKTMPKLETLAFLLKNNAISDSYDAARKLGLLQYMASTVIRKN